jgi:hypothetical protein
MAADHWRSVYEEGTGSSVGGGTEPRQAGAYHQDLGLRHHALPA